MGKTQNCERVSVTDHEESLPVKSRHKRKVDATQGYFWINARLNESMYLSHTYA